MARLRDLPKIDDLAADPRLSGYPRALRVAAAREVVSSLRAAIQAGAVPDLGLAGELVRERVEGLAVPSLRRAINLTGVILHTGLGRARLAPSAAAHVAEVAGSHSLLEFDVESGGRGDRQSHVRDVLCRLTGAEDALVLNNAAAGVLATLAALAKGGEVILSRGQMVEIGGSFRMPDVVRQSGCQLVEVGCTNKTRLRDYEQAVTPETKAILRCHPSNFRIIGFHEEPGLDELAAFARSAGLLMIDDQGNGALLGLERYGLPKEATLPESIAAGADVVVASGDKLLGGPQAGLVLGRSELISRVRKHPLARAMRIDKLSLAALEATLALYEQERVEEIPTHAALGLPLDAVRKRAEALAEGFSTVIEPGTTEVGAGAAPGVGLPTWRVGLPPASPDRHLRRLRQRTVPVIGRIQEGRVWLDPRTLAEDEITEARQAIEEAIA